MLLLLLVKVCVRGRVCVGVVALIPDVSLLLLCFTRRRRGQSTRARSSVRHSGDGDGVPLRAACGRA